MSPLSSKKTHASKLLTLEDVQNFSLGKVKGAKNNLQIRDCVQTLQSTTGLGRLWTKLKLRIQGKGWVNKNTTRQMVKELDWQNLEKINQTCHKQLDILTKLKTSYVKNKKLKQQYISDVKSIETITKLVENETKERDNNIKDILSPIRGALNIDKFLESPSRSDKHHDQTTILRPLFDRYVKSLTQPKKWESESDVHEGKSSMNIARNCLIQKTHDDISLNYIKSGFIEYLTEGLAEDTLWKEDILLIRDALMPYCNDYEETEKNELNAFFETKEELGATKPAGTDA